MGNWLKEIVYFTKSQRLGVVVFLLLCLIFQIGTALISKLPSSHEKGEEKWVTEIEAYHDSVRQPSSHKISNPEQSPADSLPESGFKIGINHFNSSGNFQSSPTSGSKEYQKKGNKSPARIVELNHADSSTLVALPGIGPWSAKSILGYRRLLGGYFCIEQLHEVYGMRQENFERFTPQLKIDTTLILKIDLNFAELKELGRHPYIGYRKGREIIKLRDRMGSFHSFEELKTILSRDSLKRIRPYLKIGN